jgi:hypothetical protein
MEELFIGTKIVAADPMDERDFALSKVGIWDEEKPNRHGYRVRHAEDNDVDWSEKETFEWAYRKMTLKEAEMVAGGQFVIPDSSGSTDRVA